MCGSAVPGSTRGAGDIAAGAADGGAPALWPVNTNEWGGAAVGRIHIVEPGADGAPAVDAAGAEEARMSMRGGEGGGEAGGGGGG